MTTPRFLQIHTLHSYPAALLNRDDSGLAKRMQFGGDVRTRVSSQSLKRHWRMADDEFALHNIDGATKALRSRNIVERKVMAPIRAASDANDEVVQKVLQAVEDAFNIGVYGRSGTSEPGRQPLLLGLPEVEHLQKRAAAICAEYAADADGAGKAATELFTATRGEGRNFRALLESARLPGGLVGAMFGRMVTSDPGANIDAAIHVAHALTIHREESESDYFSVVDDLQRDDEDAGAAHIGDMELTAGLFYGYVVVDVPGLVSNLEGCAAGDWESADRELAGQVVHNLLHLIATVSPGAKLGSTAPYSYASLMLVEAGRRQPRTLANAFRKRIEPQIDCAAAALSGHLEKLDDCYSAREVRRFMSVDDCDLPQSERLNMCDLANWTADAVRNGAAV